MSVPQDHASNIMTESNLPMQTYRETPISKAMRELEEAAIAQDLSAEKVSGLREGLLDGSILGYVSSSSIPPVWNHFPESNIVRLGFLLLVGSL